MGELKEGWSNRCHMCGRERGGRVVTIIEVECALDGLCPYNLSGESIACAECEHGTVIKGAEGEGGSKEC